VGGVVGEVFSLAGWRYLSMYISRSLGVVYIVMGEFYIMNCKWLPWGRSIVRKWGEWRGGVYLMPVFHFLFNKTQGQEGAILQRRWGHIVNAISLTIHT
jgi:hypothetical protein